MEHSTPRNPAPASHRDAGVPALTPDQARQAVLDDHGFDLADFDWVPVKRKPRADGWSAEKQRRFIEVLADTGSVKHACHHVDMSPRSAYALRRAPDGAGFDRAWTAAIRHAMHRLIDVCMERALEGSEVPIFDKEGRVVGHRVRHHDRMAMFLLRVHGTGRATRDGFVLDQRVEQEGKPATARRWVLRQVAPGRYAGTLTDARGPVTAETHGDRLHIAYPGPSRVRIEQWLTLSPDGRSARNVLKARRLGVVVARLDETITKLD